MIVKNVIVICECRLSLGYLYDSSFSSKRNTYLQSSVVVVNHVTTLVGNTLRQVPPPNTQLKTLFYEGRMDQSGKVTWERPQYIRIINSSLT